MHRHHEDSIGQLVVAVEQDHPRPRPQHKPDGRPPPSQLWPGEREGFKDSQRARDAIPSVLGKTESDDCVVYVPLGSRGDYDLCHSGSQLVERHAFAACGLSESLLSPFPGTGNCVEDLSDPRGIRISIVNSSGQERPRQGSLLYMSALGEPSKLACVGLVESDVDALR